MSKFQKGILLYEGKTKWIYEVLGRPDLVIVKNKNEITAFDDPSFTKYFKTKAQSATTTTSRVFEMLQANGIKTAFVEQIADDEFVMKRCRMLSLEVVGRDIAEGSYCARNPEFVKGAHTRFPKPIIEFFLKTSKGKLVVNKKVVIEGLRWQKEFGEEDPFINNPFDDEWNLFHPKKPASDPEANLGKSVRADDVLAPFSETRSSHAMMRTMYEEALKILVALREAFRRVSIILEDFKIEFGIDPITGEIIVSDVIDNDSWRIADENWVEYSKQRFRDGRDEIEVIEELYKTVAEFVSRPQFLKAA
jgi:phosphoribosylaminoimidazole-succinocarboxamide synthase